MKPFKPPASRKQLEFLDDLMRQTGIWYRSAPKTATAASRRIERLLIELNNPRLFDL